MLPSEPVDLVVFQLSQKRFALRAHSVLEVLALIEPTPVPGWPPHVLGLIDIRGELIPLLDVSAGLDSPEHPLSPSQYIILLKAFEQPFGIVVDLVEGVRSVVIAAEKNFPSAGMLGAPQSCDGIVEVEGRVILINPQGLIETLGATFISQAQRGATPSP